MSGDDGRTKRTHSVRSSGGVDDGARIDAGDAGSGFGTDGPGGTPIATPLEHLTHGLKDPLTYVEALGDALKGPAAKGLAWLLAPVRATKPVILVTRQTIRHVGKALGRGVAWLSVLSDFLPVLGKYGFGTPRFRLGGDFFRDLGLTGWGTLGGFVGGSLFAGIALYFGVAASGLVAAFIVTTVLGLVGASLGKTLGDLFGSSWNRFTTWFFGLLFSPKDWPTPSPRRRVPKVPKIDPSPPSPPLGAHVPKPKPTFYPPPPPWGGGPGGGVPVSGPASPPPPPPPPAGSGPAASTAYPPPPAHSGAVAPGLGGVSMQTPISARSFRPSDDADLEYLKGKRDRILEQARRPKPGTKQ